MRGRLLLIAAASLWATGAFGQDVPDLPHIVALPTTLCRVGIGSQDCPVYGDHMPTHAISGPGDCDICEIRRDIGGGGDIGFSELATPDLSGVERLDKAMAICREQRKTSRILVGDDNLRYYPDKWKACYAVADKWGKSAAGLAERKRKEQEQRDLDLVNAVAGEK